ncbi:MAG: TrbG/VirB9 family P-type conjugative transfer protein [Gluconacetobacter sp.]
MTTRIALITSLTVLAGCSAADTTPVDISVPGMMNPEMQLDRAIDNVHNFLVDFNGRLPTPARQSVALQVGAPLPVAAITNIPQAADAPPERIAPSAPRFAQPLVGRLGVTWLRYADATPRLRCEPGSHCLVWLEAGERFSTRALAASDPTGWSVHEIPGTGASGIHAAPAISIASNGDAKVASLTFQTDRRAYAWILDPGGPSMQRVRFSYHAGDPVTQPAVDQTVLALASGGTAASGPDFDYAIDGTAPWRPMRVYRDSGRTFFEFPPGGVSAAPRLVLTNPRTEGTLSYRTVGDSYVVDRPVEDAMLIGRERGAPVVSIHHGGLTPVGGTSTPSFIPTMHGDAP